MLAATTPYSSSEKRSTTCHRLIRLFVLSAGVLLFVTALAKLLTARGTARVLLSPDPIFAIPFREVLLAVAVLELLVALSCLLGSGLRLQVLLVACLSTNFVSYRVGLWLMGWHGPCGCLGTLTGALHVSPETADAVMKIILSYLLVGSYAALYYVSRSYRCRILCRNRG
jgi:hypothetical protein